MTQNIIFTRYLYLKDEVKISLLTSLIDKNEGCIFWAYELYYSGFENELFDLLWKIYFNFYYTLNPSFQQYFIKKHKEWKKMCESGAGDKDRIVSNIVNNLLIRPYNLDMFMLKQQHGLIHIAKKEKEEKEENCDLQTMLNMKKYAHIAEYILHQCDADDLYDAFDDILVHFIGKNIPLDKDKIIKQLKISVDFVDNISIRVLILSNVMLYYSIQSKLTMGKKLYIIVDPNDIIVYETIVADKTVTARNILPIVCLYEIDENNYLSLFQLERDETNIQESYYNHWEYYASFSPIWLDRIQKYNGNINHTSKKIDFIDDDNLEAFYDEFGYDPGEQKCETQNKCIKDIKNVRTWQSFYETHKKNGLYIPTFSNGTP